MLAATAWLAASRAAAQQDGDGRPSGAVPPASVDGTPPPVPDLSTPGAASKGIPELTGITATSVGLTAAGFVSAFVVHEACHAVANLSMANVPTLAPVRFLGFLPFFAVSPDITCRGGSCTRRDGQAFWPGPRGYAWIVSSGILCQEVTDEIILTGHPRIRHETEPFLKGMLLFNTATSVAYGIANLAGIEPPQGDLYGLDALGAPHGLYAALVLGTAALDVARYFLPDVPWIPWVSRGTKVLTVGMIFTF